MNPEHKEINDNGSDYGSTMSRTTTTESGTITTHASRLTTVSTRWRRVPTRERPDLEPGAEYAVTRSLTPARDPTLHDPAIWPDDLVDWDGPNDPENPRNWSNRKKAVITAQLGLTTMGAAFASSSFSPAFGAIEEQFNIGATVSVLALSLFVLGLAFGPLIFAPISELYGRKISFLPAYLGFGIFLIGVATAENIQTVMLCRFFAGLMSSAPMSNVAGSLADMYDDRTRGTAIILYSIAVVGGPTLGPLVGAAVTNSYLGWRWVEYVTSFWIFSMFVMDLLFLPETYAPVILKRKADHLRHTTGNWAIHSKLEEKELTIRFILQKNLIRPLEMLFREPIVFLFGVYNAFVYGLLYLLFEAFPIAFEQERGWTPVVSSLAFLAILVGQLIAVLIQHFYQPIFRKKLDAAKAAGKLNNPEARLPPMMLGGILFTIGLFIFGWTAAPRYFWIAPIIGAVCIGIGFILVFQSAVAYLVDAFTIQAASAQAANTLFRSLAGAGFPLFATPMFKSLGVNWAASLLGFIALALVPIPFLFYIYGARIRMRSRYVPDIIVTEPAMGKDAKEV